MRMLVSKWCFMANVSSGGKKSMLGYKCIFNERREKSLYKSSSEEITHFSWENASIKILPPALFVFARIKWNWGMQQWILILLTSFKKKPNQVKMPMGDAGVGINSWDVDRIIHVSKPSEQVYNKMESKRGKESKKMGYQHKFIAKFTTALW